MRRSVALGLLFAAACAEPSARAPRLERIGIAPDGRGFRLEESGRPFRPWGFNYDRDHDKRLLEDYWESEWSRVEEDFREMKALGANVVRVHLQFGRFMKGPAEPDGAALERLGRLLGLAEELGIYLDLTGLGNYRKSASPAWYDAASEKERWALQARFWEAVAVRCAASPAVFCYNLMNEPVSPSGPGSEWLPGPGLAGFHYVEALSKDPAGRSRDEISRAWIATLLPAVRRHDPRRPVTAGMFFLFERPGALTLGTDPEKFGAALDFWSLHLYPKEGEVPRTLALIDSIPRGKPLLVEEYFPLNCSIDTLRALVREGRERVAGWIGFYWGRTPREMAGSADPVEALTARWLEFFREEARRERP
ncbi:MAG TPA: cellulase family glycosylhydrolase [Planctomycetota bacterium]|jgi:hypothetical protein|nr:cellulase family glycosylhydrolase [Planctomycetota bacterium]